VHDKVSVPLSWSEVGHAANVGMWRHIFARSTKKTDREPNTAKPSWDRDLVGAIAEYAAAKWLGVFWRPAIGETGGTDVGPYQVRSITVPTHRLCIRPQDKDEQVFLLVLVNHATPNCPVIYGWLKAGDAKRADWQAEDWLYYVPPDMLRPLAELPA